MVAPVFLTPSGVKPPRMPALLNAQRKSNMLNILPKNKAPAAVSIAPAAALPVAVVTAPWSAETDPKVVILDARQTEISAKIDAAKKLMSDAVEKVCNVKALDAQLHELAVSRGDLLGNLVKQREHSHKDQFLASLVNLIFQRYDLMAKEGLVRPGFSSYDIFSDVENHVGPAIREVELRRHVALEEAQAA